MPLPALFLDQVLFHLMPLPALFLDQVLFHLMPLPALFLAQVKRACTGRQWGSEEGGKGAARGCRCVKRVWGKGDAQEDDVLLKRGLAGA